MQLDYSIDKAAERLTYVNDLLDKMMRRPTERELETLGTYLLWGVDDEGLNVFDRGLCINESKKGHSHKGDNNVKSLEAVLEVRSEEGEGSVEPANLRGVGSFIRPTNRSNSARPIKRPTHKSDGTEDPGDSWIPGMTDLWECIDYLNLVVRVNKGLEPPRPDVPLLSSLDRWRVERWLHDKQADQYILRDAYQPTITPGNPTPTYTPGIDWTQDSAYYITREELENRLSQPRYMFYDHDISTYGTKEMPDPSDPTKTITMYRWVYDEHTFDWEDPAHIAALIPNYSLVWQQNWDQPLSWGRTLIYDFDRYVELLNLSPMREYVLTRRIDGARPSLIKDEVSEQYGDAISHNYNYISPITTKEIPTKVSEVAERMRLISTYPRTAYHACNRCGAAYPIHEDFFQRYHRTKFDQICKRCRRDDRVRLGYALPYDARLVDPSIPPKTAPPPRTYDLPQRQDSVIKEPFDGLARIHQIETDGSTTLVAAMPLSYMMEIGPIDDLMDPEAFAEDGPEDSKTRSPARKRRRKSYHERGDS